MLAPLTIASRVGGGTEGCRAPEGPLTRRRLNDIRQYMSYKIAIATLSAVNMFSPGK
jgi:hypothetical protein